MKKKLNSNIKSDVVTIVADTKIHSMKKFDYSCLNEKGKTLIKKAVKITISDMKHHFKEDKWDIDINNVLDGVAQTVLPAIDWIVITEILSSVEDLSVQTKDNRLYFTLNKRRKKNVK